MSPPTQQNTPTAARPEDLLSCFGEESESAEIEARRGGPPADVLAQIDRAGEIYETLSASSLRVDFDLTEEGPVVRLRGADGETLRSLSIDETIELALGTGKP